MKRLPMHLRPKTRKWINRIQREYELEHRHVLLLIAAGEALDRCAEAREKLEAEGLTVKDRFNQLRAHPMIAVERDSRIAFARLLREVGLDDAAAEPPRVPRIGGK